MADKATLRTRKFLTNRLLERKQFVVDVHHPGLSNVSKDKIRGILAEKYNSEKDLVVVFGFRTSFGGGRSTGFGLIYDSKEALEKFEPTYRKIRLGIGKRGETGRKQRKERKNRAKKFRGTKKTKTPTKDKK